MRGTPPVASGFVPRADLPRPHQRVVTMRRRLTFFAAFLGMAGIALPRAATTAEPGSDGNRLAYLDELNPYYPHRDFPKLITPQWVGEPGVEAVVVLAIDDMREPARYEAFLRPILNRLKVIDGRAPLSIMTNQVDPKDERLQAWLAEGVSLECHTLTHPCPLLQKGDFAAAVRTYHGCVDLMNQIDGNKPVAFRMPCCDSLNTVSPRFFAEIFNKTSPGGHHLSIDSSVFTVLSPDDPSLPRSLVFDPDGRERFRKYIPFPSFVNTIENYPYPFVIGRRCWEFPCIVPSDWEGNHVHKPANAKTLADLKAALDCVVIKRGVFNLVFHPYGWITSEQVVELIDHAVTKHGKKIKFLNFREALERLNKNLLDGKPIRSADQGDAVWQILDMDDDGYMDVAISTDQENKTRTWSPTDLAWNSWNASGEVPSPRRAARFKDLRTHFSFIPDPVEHTGLPRLVFTLDNRHSKTTTEIFGIKPPWQRLDRDIDGDGITEIIIGSKRDSAVFKNPLTGEKLPFGLPPGARLLDDRGRDAGLRLVDLDEDGQLDILFSSDDGYGIYLFESMKAGWTRKVMAGKPSEPSALPRIVRDGQNNGFFVQARHLWWQNEDTASLPNLVDRRSFNELLKNVEPRGKSPGAALRSMRVAPGFQVELAAAEPLVKDPIAFEWGADGKLWVVEMGDYPLGIDGKGKFGGVVRFLEDTDGDFRYDKQTTFLDGLGFPTGVMPWRGGVLVACAPDIFYAEDRDGDGKADHREVLYTGFVEGNQQHRLNGFELGLDGWIYGANGDSGGVVRSLKTGKRTSINGRDFRFRPDTGEFEAESGQTQYGRHRDDWGRWFGNNNPNWAWHFVLAAADLGRNPLYASPDPRQTLEPETRCYPASRTVMRFNDLNMANHVTSANSPTPYRDELFGPWFATSLFVSEPVHNLVHRIVLEPDGATFRGRRGPNESESEFLASTDNWFRPTMLKTGPDGALWIADMYRYVIEHPEWIPDDWEKRLDLRAGSEEGRIYRVYPLDQQPRPIPRLDLLDTAGLVAALESPSGWQRDTAQRLLLHRNDPTAIKPLRTLASSTRRPKTRVQAIWTLSELGGLDEPTALEALVDSRPEVRSSVIAAVRPMVGASPKVASSMLMLAGDADPQVRFQVALALGDWHDRRAGLALAQLARRDGHDAWMRAADLSSALPHLTTLLANLLGGSEVEAPAPALVEPLLALAGSLPDRSINEAVARSIGVPAGQSGRYAPWQLAAVAGLLEARHRSRKPLGLDLDQAFAGLWRAARGLLADDSAGEADRLAAVKLLGHSAARNLADRDLLVGLLRPQVAIALQQAAVAALGRTADPKLADLLVHDWRGHSPQVKGAIVDLLLSRSAWTTSFLRALEDGYVPAAELDPARRQRLLSRRDEKQKARAEAIFAHQAKPRQAIVDSYRPVLSMKGDRAAGAALFDKLCASCHRLANHGVDVGPDLAALNDKSAESLLIAILDPNRAFEAKYASFTVATVDGRVLTGLIASESATSLTLRRQDGKDDVMLRSDIQEMAAAGGSLMPEGLEKDLKPRDLADLIAFLASSGPSH
jgi:putative membrane-bound dehydrogenase-like protein